MKLKKLISLAFIIIIFVFAYHISTKNKYGQSIYVDGSDNPYSILIDVEITQLTVFKGGKVFKIYPCSGGKTTTPSPIGTWRIKNKSQWGEGFGGRWLGLNVPWGEYGIHGTIYPETIGRTSSHGCIRMLNKDIKSLYSYIPIGTTVTIIDGPYGVWGRGFRTLKPGMRDSDVMEIQKKLKELGYYNADIDGIYGKQMIKAVHKYQTAYNMPVSDIIDKDFIQKLGFIEWE